MQRKYVKVQIAGKGREYTYHCEDDDIQPGDTVEFTLPSGHSMTGEVREVDLNQPNFPTKPCLKVAI